jgi:uncharacterized glyoxalase superfamily protein PhnB
MPERVFEELDRAVQAILAGSTEIGIRRQIEPLVAIAAELRHLPRREFKDRLRRSLDWRKAMPTATSTALDVTPYLVVQDAEGLIDFVKDAFGAEELMRAIGSMGGVHCEVRMGGAKVMIGGGGQWRGTPAPGSLHLFVDDVDSRYQRALAAGATSLGAPIDQEYGVREASVRDRFGNHWYIARDLGVGDFWKAVPNVMPYFHPVGAAAMIDFLRNALGAEVLERFEEHGSVVHARVRIGQATVELGEAHGEWNPMPMHLYVTVDDADAAHARAVAAGGTSTAAPADAPYGRSGAVEDPFGNRWYLVAPK